MDNNEKDRKFNEFLANVTVVFLIVLVAIVAYALPANADTCTQKYKVRDSRGVTVQSVRVYSDRQGTTTKVNVYNTKGQRTGSYVRK